MSTVKFKNIKGGNPQKEKDYSDCGHIRIKRKTSPTSCGAVFIPLNYTKDQLLTNEDRRAYCFFLILKSRQNIYKFKYSDLMKITGTTYYICKKYLDICLKKKWIFKNNGNIICTAWAKITPEKRRFKVNIEKSYQHIYEQLRNIIFKNIIDRQKFMIKLRIAFNYMIRFHEPKKIKKIKKFAKKYLSPTRRGRSAAYINNGYRSLSRQLGINQSKVKGELERFKKLGLIVDFYSIKHDYYQSTTKFIVDNMYKENDFFLPKNTIYPLPPIPMTYTYILKKESKLS